MSGSDEPKKVTLPGRSVKTDIDQLLMKSMRGNQAIKRAADTSDVDTRVMDERQQRLNRDVLEKQRRQQQQLERRQEREDDFQKRFDALYEKRQQSAGAPQELKQVQQGELRARQQTTTVRPPPKPITRKFSTKIPVSERTTLEPVRMGEGYGGGLKATVKFK